MLRKAGAMTHGPWPTEAQIKELALPDGFARGREYFERGAVTHVTRRGAELADSLRQHGLLQPVVVRRRGRSYELIAGHHRYQAAQRLGWTDTSGKMTRSSSAISSGQLLSRASSASDRNRTGMRHAIRDDQRRTRPAARTAAHRPRGIDQRLHKFRLTRRAWWRARRPRRRMQLIRIPT